LANYKYQFLANFRWGLSILWERNLFYWALNLLMMIQGRVVYYKLRRTKLCEWPCTLFLFYVKQYSLWNWI